jgi:AraC family ethanolamine operon transcriptional activator
VAAAVAPSDALPRRQVRVETDDPDELVGAQPERKRRVDQLGAGRFQAELIEAAWGAAALQTERWSCGLRVRSDRPPGYVTFALVVCAGDTRWCGTPLAPGELVRIEEPWELACSGAVELVAFAVDRARLRDVEARLAGGERGPAPTGNARARVEAADRLGDRLRRLLGVVGSSPLASPALAAAEADLFHLAAALERGVHEPVERAAPATRRRAVRRVEEYLDADREATPSIAALCAVAGVSERTLEYAFREQLGMTPVRFLKLRRLNRVRRELLDAAAGAAGVAAAAQRAGVYDLGRFAGEYRQLFGELPSQTLRRARGGLSRAAAEPFPAPPGLRARP